MKPNIFLFDLDWTLCELYPERPGKYSGQETPIKAWTWFLWVMIEHFRTRKTYFKVWIITGRKEQDFTQQTWDWFEFYFPKDLQSGRLQLFMQPGSVAKKNHIWKEEKLLQLMEEYEIMALVDDNPDMQDVCKRLWIPFYLFCNPKTIWAKQ